MSLLIETIELIAGLGVLSAGALGSLKTKVALWRIPFVLFVLTGFFMTIGATLGIAQSEGALSYSENMISYVLSIGRILLILSIAYLTYMLALLYDRAHLGVLMLSKKGFRSISKRLKMMYGYPGAKQILYSMGKEAEYYQLRDALAKWGISEKSFVHWLPSLYPLFGWGSKLSVEYYKPKKSLVLRTQDNFEVVPIASSGGNSCDFTRGIFAGLGKGLNSDLRSEAIETKCQSWGDEYCEFEVNFYPRHRM